MIKDVFPGLSNLVCFKGKKEIDDHMTVLRSNDSPNSTFLTILLLMESLFSYLYEEEYNASSLSYDFEESLVFSKHPRSSLETIPKSPRPILVIKTKAEGKHECLQSNASSTETSVSNPLMLVKLSKSNPPRIANTKTTSIISFFGGAIGHLFYSAFDAVLTSAEARPTWDRWTNVGIQFIRKYQTYRNGSLAHVRIGIDGLTLPFFAYENTIIKVHVASLLEYERSGKPQTQGTIYARYPVPIDKFLQSQDHYEIKGQWSTPAKLKSENCIFMIHGGAFVFGSSKLYKPFAQAVAAETGCCVFTLDYRLAPEHPFPESLHDCFAAYLWLMNPDSRMFTNPFPTHKGYPASSIIIMGDSAGGNLALALQTYISNYITPTVHSNLHTPLQNSIQNCRALVLLSPWVDLTCTSKSYIENKDFDIVPFKLSNIHEPITNSFEHPVHSYCFGINDTSEINVFTPKHDGNFDVPPLLKLRRIATSSTKLSDNIERVLRHPLISPIFAIYGTKSDGDMPDILVQSGDAEVLRDESLAIMLKYKGCKVMRHEMYVDMVHAFQLGVVTPGAILARRRVVEFIAECFEGAPVSRLSEDEKFVCLVDSHVPNK